MQVKKGDQVKDGVVLRTRTYGKDATAANPVVTVQGKDGRTHDVPMKDVKK